MSESQKAAAARERLLNTPGAVEFVEALVDEKAANISKTGGGRASTVSGSAAILLAAAGYVYSLDVKISDVRVECERRVAESQSLAHENALYIEDIDRMVTIGRVDLSEAIEHHDTIHRRVDNALVALASKIIGNNVELNGDE